MLYCAGEWCSLERYDFYAVDPSKSDEGRDLLALQMRLSKSNITSISQENFLNSLPLNEKCTASLTKHSLIDLEKYTETI